ncbi:hypothetical protein FBU59_002159 [Linderina macrospora]|uniref:Uncharacterized protein n=1 Tax=Linderina macrospora TaxID=4868 RepID=A0ACC1JC49_9FUNG|nr:hypothetical protein FBU59_002159 [Linderina macrospora]
MPVSPTGASAKSPTSTSAVFTPMADEMKPRAQLPPPPVARASAMKQLSPLPTISPNNFQASFDRGMALREIVAVADYISGHGVGSFGHPSTDENEIVRKSARAARMEAHKQVVASALLVADNSLRDIRIAGASPKPRKQVTPPGTAKSVHWFDSPEAERKRSPAKNSRRKRRAQRCEPPMSPLREERQQLASPQIASAKVSSEMSMSIVLRSPSTKSSAIASPLSSPKTIAGPLPAMGPAYPPIPIMSPVTTPRMVLSHKASISAVGGRRNCSPHLHQQPPPNVTSSNIVTIRARRSQSFAVQRRLARATTGGRRRSNTVGTGRQADVGDSRENDDDPAAFPLADKEKRRVKSMFIEPQSIFDIRSIRSRYMTVIPLRVELQRHLLMKLAKDGGVATNIQLMPLSESDGLFLADAGLFCFLPYGTFDSIAHERTG